MKKRVGSSTSEIVEDFKGDMWGQVLTTQQRVDALSARLGAVERRLSLEMGEGGEMDLMNFEFTRGELDSLEARLEYVENSTVNTEIKNEMKTMKKDIDIIKEEHAGVIKQPPSPVFQWATYRVGELSGVVAGISAVSAAVLIATDNMEALKSPLFSLFVGITLITVAAASWRKKKRDEELDVIYIP